MVLSFCTLYALGQSTTEYRVGENDPWTKTKGKTFTLPPSAKSFQLRFLNALNNTYTYAHLRGNAPLTSRSRTRLITDTVSTSRINIGESTSQGYFISVTGTLRLSFIEPILLITPKDGNWVPLSFHFQPTRNKNTEEISKQLYALTFTEKELRNILRDNFSTSSLDTIRFQLLQQDNIFFPNEQNYNIPSSDVTQEGNVIMESSIPNSKTVNNNSNTFNKYQLSLNNNASYTWLFDLESKKITLLVNKDPIPEPTSKTIYALGNFTSHSNTNEIKPYEQSDRVKMQRMIYMKNTPGVGKLDNIADYDPQTMDSIVYRVTLPRPIDGWENLRLSAAKGELIMGSSQQDWTGKNSNWSKVYRPQVQGYGSDNLGMDATALRGGIFEASKETNKAQVINPILSDEDKMVSTYTFSINLTTATYHLSFNSAPMYILGSSVAKDNDGAKEIQIEQQPADRKIYSVPMVWDNEQQCFKYLVNGTETPIHLHSTINAVLSQANRFRFVYDNDYRNTWFGEDGNNEHIGNGIPADLTTSDKPYTADGEQYDTQYVNYLSTYRSTKNNYADFSKDIKFLLPERDRGYTLRLYIRKIGDEMKYFYTINRKIGLNDLQLDSEQLIDGNTHYRAFSEYHAYKLPQGINMYIVTATDKNQKRVRLTDITNLGIIPARTGVILATKNYQGTPIFETYVDNPQLTLSELLPQLRNLLKAQVENVEIKEKEENNGQEMYNYILGAELNKENLQRSLGFYLPVLGTMSGRNYAYLLYSNGLSVARSLKVFKNNNISTTDINTIKGQTKEQNLYFDLEGRKIGDHLSHGLYIQQGRKFLKQ